MPIEEGHDPPSVPDNGREFAAKHLQSPLEGGLKQPIDVERLSPAALAYVGDAVYELYVRLFYLVPPRSLKAYHRQVVDQVRAESQMRQLRSLEPHLTALEREIVRRGRNAAVKGPKRIALNVYQQASSLEALIGYLYLTDPARLTQLLLQLDFEISSAEGASSDF